MVARRSARSGVLCTAWVHAPALFFSVTMVKSISSAAGMVLPDRRWPDRKIPDPQEEGLPLLVDAGGERHESLALPQDRS